MRQLGLFALLIVVTSSLLAGPAAADQDMEALDRRLVDVAPEPNRDKATVGPPTWCGSIKPEPSRSVPQFIAMKIEEADRNGWNHLIEAARKVCDFPPAPAISRASAIILQHWINLTGMSERGAAYSLAARVDADGFKAGRARVCDALQLSDEVIGEQREAMIARRKLLGCRPDDLLWSSSAAVPDELLTYLDQSAEPLDELVRLAWVLSRTRLVDSSPGTDHDARVVAYAVDAIDFGLLSDAKIMAALDAEPYKGNPYAQAVVRESIGRARRAIAIVQAEVQTRARDAAWAEVLIAAPRRAVDAYVAAATTFKAQIARSNEFEHKLITGTRSAVKGCTSELRKDLVSVWKTLDRGTARAAHQSLSHPVVSLLFERFVWCTQRDGDKQYAQALDAVPRRPARGMRFEAYYGALEAVGKVREERPRFPVHPGQLPDILLPGQGLSGATADSDATPAPTKSDAERTGVIQSATKRADGVMVKFVKKKRQVLTETCEPTNRIFRIGSNGVVEYYQSCKPAGRIWVDTTPDDVIIPTELADGVAPGRLMKYGWSRGSKPEQWGFPIEVYADKDGTKLANYLGFGL